MKKTLFIILLLQALYITGFSQLMPNDLQYYSGIDLNQLKGFDFCTNDNSGYVSVVSYMPNNCSGDNACSEGLLLEERDASFAVVNAKSYSNGDGTYLHANVIEKAVDGYVIGGSIYDVSKGISNTAFLLYVDNNFDVIWFKTYERTAIISTIVTTDYEFIVSTNGPYFVNINSPTFAVNVTDGSVIWQFLTYGNKYPITANGKVSKLIKLNDDNFVGIGNINTSIEESDWQLIRFDASGSIMKHIALGFDDFNYGHSQTNSFTIDHATAVTYDEEENVLYITGLVYHKEHICATNTTNLNHIFVTKFSLDEKVGLEWTKIYNLVGDDIDYGPRTSTDIKIFNNNVYISGTYKSNASYSQTEESFILALDKDGNIFDNRFYESNTLNSNFFKKMVIDNDINAIGVCKIDGRPEDKLHLVKYFELIAERCNMYNNNLEVNDIKFPEQRVFLIENSIREGEYSAKESEVKSIDDYICTARILGKLANSQSPKVDETDIKIEVISDKYILKNYTIIDLQGNIIESGSINKNSFTFIKNKLAKGMYVLKIIDEYNSIETKKFISIGN